MKGWKTDDEVVISVRKSGIFPNQQQQRHHVSSHFNKWVMEERRTETVALGVDPVSLRHTWWETLHYPALSCIILRYPTLPYIILEAVSQKIWEHYTDFKQDLNLTKACFSKFCRIITFKGFIDIAFNHFNVVYDFIIILLWFLLLCVIINVLLK